jgi:hypothetical protein
VVSGDARVLQNPRTIGLHVATSASVRYSSARFATGDVFG